MALQAEFHQNKKTPTPNKNKKTSSSSSSSSSHPAALPKTTHRVASVPAAAAHKTDHKKTTGAVSKPQVKPSPSYTQESPKPRRPSLPEKTPKSRPRYDEDEDGDGDEDEDEDDSFVEDDEEEGDGSTSLQQVLKDVFRYDRTKYKGRALSQDDDLMEATYDQIQSEERKRYLPIG